MIIMFGYIRIDKYELKYKQFIEYKKMYCSLCNSLKDNLGVRGCMLTSYDATLFLTIFDSIEVERQEYKLSCPINPFKKVSKNIFISKTAMKYTAFLSAYYAYIKLNDDIKDEGKRKYKRQLKHLENNSKFKILYKIDDGLLNTLNKKVTEYYKMEKQKVSDFDDLSNKMGELFGEAFTGYLKFSNVVLDENVLYNIGFNIGKWIYIADAFDDLENDIKKQQFNPILFMTDYNLLNNEELSNKILFISKCLTQNVYYELSKLRILRNKEIIHNILIYGMNNSILKIANKNISKGVAKDE